MKLKIQGRESMRHRKIHLLYQWPGKSNKLGRLPFRPGSNVELFMGRIKCLFGSTQVNYIHWFRRRIINVYLDSAGFWVAKIFKQYMYLYESDSAQCLISSTPESGWYYRSFVRLSRPNLIVGSTQIKSLNSNVELLVCRINAWKVRRLKPSDTLVVLYDWAGRS